MISIRTSADMARALAGSMDPDLRALLTLRRDQWLDGQSVDLMDLVHAIVVQKTDTLAALEAEAGIPLATNLVDDAAADLVPAFEFVERHGNWFEGVIILADDGYGLALFVPDRVEIDPAITQLLRAHA